MNRQHVSTLPPFHQRGIAALAFHPDGTRLASVGLDDEHSLAVWKDQGGAWSKLIREATGKGDRNAVFFLTWLAGGGPKEENDENYFPLVSGGSKHIRFWRVSGGALSSKKGVFGKIGPPQHLLCAANLVMEGEWRLVTGASSGEILVWRGRDCLVSRPAHDRAVQAMAGVAPGSDPTRSDGMVGTDFSRLVTGGKEGKVKVWNAALEIIQEYDLTVLRTCLEPSVKALDFLSGVTTNAKGLNITRILVGTGGAEIFELPTDQRQLDGNLVPLVQGHFLEELWGLDVLKGREDFGSLFTTSGDDGTVRIWDADTHNMVGRFFLPKRRARTAAPAKKAAPAGKAKPSGAGGEKAANSREGFAQKGGGASDMNSPAGENQFDAEGGKGDGASEGGMRQMSRAVAWEPRTGSYLLVGLGGDTGSNKATRIGGHLVLRVERDKGRWEVRGRNDEALPVYVSRLEKEWVSDVKWCPDGGTPSLTLTYAVGSHDNVIRVYAIPAKLQPEADGNGSMPDYLLRLQGHNAFITHMDFSNPGPNGVQWMQSNCGGYELLFWDVTEPMALRKLNAGGGDDDLDDDYKTIKAKLPVVTEKPGDMTPEAQEKRVEVRKPIKATTTRNAEWNTWSCILGWPVQGIWTGTMDG